MRIRKRERDGNDKGKKTNTEHREIKPLFNRQLLITWKLRTSTHHWKSLPSSVSIWSRPKYGNILKRKFASWGIYSYIFIVSSMERIKSTRNLWTRLKKILKYSCLVQTFFFISAFFIVNTEYFTFYFYFFLMHKMLPLVEIRGCRINKWNGLSSTIIHIYFLISGKIYCINTRNISRRRYLSSPSFLHHIYLFLSFLSPFSNLSISTLSLYHSITTDNTIVIYFSRSSAPSPHSSIHHSSVSFPRSPGLLARHAPRSRTFRRPPRGTPRRPSLPAAFSCAVKGGLSTLSDRYGSPGKCFSWQGCSYGVGDQETASYLCHIVICLRF